DSVLPHRRLSPCVIDAADSLSRRVARVHPDLGTDISADVRRPMIYWMIEASYCGKNSHSRVAVPHHPIINSTWKPLDRAKRSSDGLRPQPAPRVPVYTPR